MSLNNNTINQSQLQQNQDPEITFLERAYRPKPRIRDEKDMRYIEQQKQLQKGQKIINDSVLSVNMTNDFVPTQDLIMEKEKIKREKLFAKQVANIIKIEVNKANYILEPEQNHLKWDLKSYQKNGKDLNNQSMHLQAAGLKLVNQSNINQSQIDNSLEDQVYIEVKLGTLQYKSEFSRALNAITEQGEKNPYEFDVDWQNQEFEFTKTTETKVYFTVRIKDPDSSYRKRYNWLVSKYDGDPIIGVAKLDLAQLAISKEKEETKIKDVRIKRQDNDEIIGTLNVGLTYKKSEYNKKIYKQLEKNLSVKNLSVDFSKVDLSKIKEQMGEYGDIQYYVKVRVGHDSQQTEDSSMMSINSSQEFQFKKSPEIKKLYIEAHLKNNDLGFNECIGIGAFPIQNFDKFEENQIQAEEEGQIPLVYKGKTIGQARFTMIKYKQESYQPKKVQSPIDIKEKSKPTALDIQRQKVLETKQLLQSQKLYEMNLKKQDPLKQNSPQIIKSKVGELVLPQIRTNVYGSVGHLPSQSQSLTMKNSSLVNLNPKPINIERITNNRYKQQIFGRGFSGLESATSLQKSVPHFSIPKEPRFIQKKSSNPAPGTYGNNGLLEEIAKIDRKLQIKRQRDFQEFKKIQQYN